MIHDGFKNTYSFIKDGVKLSWVSSKMKVSSKPLNPTGNNFISKQEFVREFEGLH